MRSRHIAIIGAPLDLGAGRRGVDMGPSAVRVANLNGRLAELGYQVEDLGNVPVIQRESQGEVDSRAKYLPQIAETCTLVAEMVAEALAIGQVSAGAGWRPFHRGGHGIGRVAAFSSARRKTGFDLDRRAHGHEYAGQQPERQRSRHAAGVLHRPGAAGTDEIFGYSPKVDPANVALVGIRSVDGQERDIVQRSGVHAFTMRDIDERGMRSRV